VLLPLQTCPEGHDPQLSVCPHPSETLPHVLPCAAHDFGVQAPNGTGFFTHATMSEIGLMRTSGLDSA
jgi:hypothetical protein